MSAGGSSRGALAAMSRNAKRELVHLLFGGRDAVRPGSVLADHSLKRQSAADETVKSATQPMDSRDPNAFSYSELRQAYLKRVQVLHPDKHRSVPQQQDQVQQEFVQLQEAWNKYDEVAKNLKRVRGGDGVDSSFTLFGVGCSFSDNETERKMREEITDQACRGWFSSGSLVDGNSDSVSQVREPVSLVDDALFVEQDGETERKNTRGGVKSKNLVQGVRPSLVASRLKPHAASTMTSRRQTRPFTQTSATSRGAAGSDHDSLDSDSRKLLESFANLDHGRAKRTGFPEAVFAEGKTTDQVAKILDDMARNSIETNLGEDGAVMARNPILATRVSEEMYLELSQMSLKYGTIEYHPIARIVSMKVGTEDENKLGLDETPSLGRVVVATAGTTDLPVAEEAAVTLEAAGCEVDRLFDVGVAGLHRIINALPRLRHPDVNCVIVCAGMDGALPSVVGGLVSVPVVAVPTSIGYGASFGGVSALLTMLNSCSPGVAVVNIDNGFGAAAVAFKAMCKSRT